MVGTLTLFLASHAGATARTGFSSHGLGNNFPAESLSGVVYAAITLE
jgi:hypothetical protein